MSNARATFGAGCFWGVEARFAALPGVLDTAAGYAGGTTPQPTYDTVCAGNTGHAEVVDVSYNPERISYAELLDAFFGMHNPTQPYLHATEPRSTRRNQYRSLILTRDEQQASAARAHIAALEASKRWPQPFATSVEPLTTFWRAEVYHQRYLERRNLLPQV